MHIAIAGNIGSGKTTLTELLSKQFGWEPHYEDVESNPYLNSFYEDMQRWSFNLQIYFLTSRFRQIVNIHTSGKNVIQDRTIYEDAHIFAPNLHAMNFGDQGLRKLQLPVRFDQCPDQTSRSAHISQVFGTKPGKADPEKRPYL